MADVITEVPTFSFASEKVIQQVSRYPRLRYMGSKYRVIPYLVSVFDDLPFTTALDAFSGSGVVAYAMKSMAKQVTANDFLSFASAAATATVENPGVRLSPEEVETILGAPRDNRSFILDTFRGLYFPDEDHEFLDSAWSHIDQLPLYKREVAISALCLAAARKQPRGVFTVTDLRYDDGRRSLRMPLREQFLSTVDAFNSVVFEGEYGCRSLCSDVFQLDPSDYDLVYLDPPYAPPKDDNDYIKRYHFLEGLSVYWRGQTILEETKTRKLAKRFTPFAYKRTIREALYQLFKQFSNSIIVLSYSSNSVPSEREIFDLMKLARPDGDIRTLAIPHRYHFGTHKAVSRSEGHEYIFVLR